MTDEEVRAEVLLLEDMLEGIDGDAAATVAALARLYGEALRRITVAVGSGNAISGALINDELVSHLLAVHDLLPDEATPGVSAAIAYGPVLLA